MYAIKLLFVNDVWKYLLCLLKLLKTLKLAVFFFKYFEIYWYFVQHSCYKNNITVKLAIVALLVEIIVYFKIYVLK